jgi:hypothetical protein
VSLRFSGVSREALALSVPVPARSGRPSRLPGGLAEQNTRTAGCSQKYPWRWGIPPSPGIRAEPRIPTSPRKRPLAADEALVTSEIEAAGFKLIEHGDFLRVPGDTRDTHSHSSAQPVDIYVLKFRKPG